MPDHPPFTVGDEVELRKPHACGSNRWTVTRTGADVRVRCLSCGRSVLIPRPDFRRMLRRVLGCPPGPPS